MIMDGSFFARWTIFIRAVCCGARADGQKAIRDSWASVVFWNRYEDIKKETRTPLAPKSDNRSVETNHWTRLSRQEYTSHFKKISDEIV